jgi:hypothetical protein
MANIVSGYEIIALDNYDAHLIKKIKEHESFDSGNPAKIVTAALLLLSKSVETTMEKKKKEAEEKVKDLDIPTNFDPF